MAISPESEARVRVFIAGARKAFANANSLYWEARALAFLGATARALFLHQISLEECGKIELLGGAVTQLLLGHDLDTKRFNNALISHRSKNRQNAYFLPVTEAEAEARQDRDAGRAVEVFKNQQAQFHQESNDGKNAALYVNVDASATSPKEAISKEMLRQLRALNKEFLGLTRPKVNVLIRHDADLQKAALQVAQMHEVIVDLRKEFPDDPFKAMETLMARLHDLVESGKYPGA